MAWSGISQGELEALLAEREGLRQDLRGAREAVASLRAELDAQRALGEALLDDVAKARSILRRAAEAGEPIRWSARADRGCPVPPAFQFVGLAAVLAVVVAAWWPWAWW